MRCLPRVALLFLPLLAAQARSQDVGSLVRVVLKDGGERRGVLESRKDGLLALRTEQGVTVLNEHLVREVRNVKVPPAPLRKSPPPPPPPVTAREIAAAVKALGDPQPQTRGKAEDFLLLHRVEARPALIEALRAPSKDARAAAARVLGDSARDATVREALRQALVQDADPLVRRLAARALRHQDPEGMRELYLQALDHERDVAARKSIILSLVQLRDPTAIPGLVRLLDQETDAYLRACVVQGLKRLAGGAAFGEDARAWDEWWSRNQERLTRQAAETRASIAASPAWAR
jgi:HEAT repeat protein